MKPVSASSFLAVIIVLCGLSVFTADAALLSGDNSISFAAGDQSAPAICRGTTTILAVWSDARSNPFSFYEYETGKDIYGMRMDQSGNLLDPLPIPIVTKQANQENPKIAWNGSNWLVVYESYDAGGTGYYQKSLEAVRVSPQGIVLDSKPIKLIGLIPSGMVFAVASDGNNWVVVNQATSVNYDIVAMRISPDGILLDPATVSLVKATYYSRVNLKLAYASGVFFATFDDQYVNGVNTTSAIRFDSNLNRLDPALIPFLSMPLSDLSSNGSQFFAVWNQQLPDFSMAVTGSRIGTNGQRLDGNGKNISGNFPNTSYEIIGSVWDGLNWRVTWGNNGTLRTARFSTTGTVLDPGGIAVPGPKTGPGTGTGNGGVQLISTVNSTNINDVQSTNINSSNVAGPNRGLSLGTPRQTRSDIAANGSGSMIVFLSATATQVRVMAQPLDASGNSLIAEPVQLYAGDAQNPPSAPNVAWNGSLYLVTWSDTNGVKAQRLQANGNKIDNAPFLVMASAFGPADVAALGGDFLVVARKFGYTPQIINAIGARIRGSDGIILDTTPLAFTSNYARSPAVTTLAGQWLVAFHNNWTHDNSTADTLGAFVSSNGTITNFKIHGPFSTAGGNGIFEVALASNGSVALMVQSQELSSGVETDLLGRFIYSNSTVGPVVNFTPWSGNQYRPRASWDGSNFVVVFQDQKNRLALNTLDQLDARSDLFGMRINSSGQKIDPQGFVFSANANSETDPSVVSLNGVSLLSGSVMLNSSSLCSYRITISQFGTSTNKWPVANITPSIPGGDVPLSVNFSSSGSSDPDGSIISYQWNFGDGGTSTQANPAHTYTAPSENPVMLIVTDNTGVQTKQALMIEVTAPNQIPVAIASANRTTGSAPLDVIFYADGSYDPDGFTGNIEWLFSDGGNYWGSPAYHTFYSTGSFTVTLRVYDGRGGVGTDNITIDVGAMNQPPVANAGATPVSGSVPLTVAFSSAGSSDPDGAITGYHWDFGDAVGSSNLANPTYTYNYTGSFTATLTVTDNNNISSSDSVVINVNPSTSTVLRSTAINLSVTSRAKKVSVNGQVTVRTGSNVAASGATVFAIWTKPGGTTVSQTATTNSSGVASFSTSGTSGTYTLTITNITKSGYTFDAANSILSKSITK